MSRKVSPEKMALALNMMTIDNLGQHEIHRQTGLSRPFIKKLADQVGYQFPRNGYEVLGQICMCAECGEFFRRPPSKIKKVKNNNLFCSEYCCQQWRRGANHKDWKGGKTINSWSSWAKNQAAYGEWREQVLARDGYKCVISGRTDNLHCHHIALKNEQASPEKTFLVDNGITLNEEIHREIHTLIKDGKGFDECLEILKEKYKRVKDS